MTARCVPEPSPCRHAEPRTHRAPVRPWSIAAALLAAALGTTAVQAADDAPPIKPGLWEMVMESQQVDGRTTPSHTAEMNRQLNALPPEVRKQVEAQMKERGLLLQSGQSGADAVRMCLTSDLLRTRNWQPSQGGRCENQVVSRSGNTWRWKTTCSQPPSQSEGSTTFLNNESYVSETRSSTDVNGRLQTIAVKHRAKWITSDCRGVRPLQLDGRP